MKSGETPYVRCDENSRSEIAQRYTARSIVVFGFVTIVGPPLGFLWFVWLGTIASTGFDGVAAFVSQGLDKVFNSMLKMLKDFPSDMLGVTPGAYFFGGVQALAVAGWMGQTVSKTGWISVWRSGFAALCVSLALAAVFTVPTILNGTIVNGISGRLTILTILGVLSILSAMTCQIILALCRVLRRPIVV